MSSFKILVVVGHPRHPQVLSHVSTQLTPGICLQSFLQAL
jgi:hypothetical protein